MKKRLMIIVVLSLILLISTAVYAVPTLGDKLPSTTCYYFYDNYLSSNSKYAINSGTSAWTNLACDVNYYYSASGYIPYVTEVKNTTVDWDGYTQPWVYQGTNIYSSETVYINTSKTNTYNNSSALKSVVAHEFGHVLGLADDGYNKTLMNGYTWGANSRYGAYTITAPTSQDVSAANSIY